MKNIIYTFMGLALLLSLPGCFWHTSHTEIQRQVPATTSTSTTTLEHEAPASSTTSTTMVSPTP